MCIANIKGRSSALDPCEAQFQPKRHLPAANGAAPTPAAAPTAVGAWPHFQLRDAGKPAPQNEVERAKANAKVLWAKTTSWWSGLSLANQGMIGASPILLLVVFTLLRRAGRRRAQAADAQAAAAWVQPSDEYLDQQDEGFDEDNYEDDFDPEFDEGEYTEQGDLEGDSFEDDGQPKFDTSGWEDDSDKQAVPDGANPEDDLFR